MFFNINRKKVYKMAIYIEDQNHAVVGYIEGNRIEDQNHATVIYIEGNHIQNENHETMAYTNRNSIRLV
jgi:hypothetical protein